MNGFICHPLAGLAPSPLWKHPLPSGESLIPSDPFGSDRGSRTHGGVDYSCRNIVVLAPSDGRVERAGWWREDTGIVVALEQAGGITHELLHLSSVNVQPGQYVKAGDTVGISGNTGTRETTRGRSPVAWHLHWQVRIQVAEAKSMLERVRNLPAGFSNHPSMLRALNQWLNTRDQTPLAALLADLEKRGPVALGVA